jgi:uncharacterized protein YycO
LARIRQLYLVVIAAMLCLTLAWGRSDLLNKDGVGLILSTAQEVAHGRLNGVFPGRFLHLDARVLEPGDILVCHNPGGSYGYWTHAVIYTGHGFTVDAFDFLRGTALRPLSEYGRYAEAAVLRVKVSPELRQKAAQNALREVGKSYDPFSSLSDPHSEYCSKLIWRVYKNQGIELCRPKPWVLPDDLYKSSKLEVIAAWRR